MDPILEYLLEFNRTNPIERSDRYIIPVGGLQKMLDDFKGYHLNRIEVTKDELTQPNDKWGKSPLEDSTIEELYALID